jgi:hypothetical protein
MASPNCQQVADMHRDGCNSKKSGFLLALTCAKSIRLLGVTGHTPRSITQEKFIRSHLMATTNWSAARQLQEKIPHTYTAMEHLIMAMADAYNNRGKTSFFGNDKGLKSYMKFEEKLKSTLIALTIDGLVSRFDTSEKFRDALLVVVQAWFEIFSNWPDAAAFAYEKLVANPEEARKLIASLAGLQK